MSNTVLKIFHLGSASTRQNNESDSVIPESNQGMEVRMSIPNP